MIHSLIVALIQIGLLSVILIGAAMIFLARAFRPKRHWKTMPRRYPKRIVPPRTVQGIPIPKRKELGRG